LGYKEKAYTYFNETGRLDLENTHGNTKDGLHMANMGGTWMAIVFGFAGLRVKESGLSLAPDLPDKCASCKYHLQYQARLIKVHIEKSATTYVLLDGEALHISHSGETLYLENGK